MKNRLGLLLAAICLLGAFVSAQTLDVVHRFQSDGGAYGRLIQASDGDFYGTTTWGGTNGVGTIFRMDGAGAVTTLHSFGYTEGAYPKAALLQGADGDLYGTASEGGANNLGTVFKMDSAGSVTTLFNFSGPDGANPWAPLIQTADGNFYGTTRGGGARAYGTAFKMDSAGNVTTLHSFVNSDGRSPYAALLKAADGYFYGTTAGAQTSFGCFGPGCGTVFKMDAAGNFTTIHTFSNLSGANPHGALVEDADGNLYATTTSHRRYVSNPPHYVTVYGTVFKIDAAGVFSTLHTFTATEGSSSPGGVVQAADGNFYGTTYGGGTCAGCLGAIFKVSPFTLLHTFTGPDGSSPYAGLLQASNGNLYGATVSGGTGGVGTVFRMNASNSLTTLYNFANTEGLFPQASLIQTPDGAFYGTTRGGGARGYGTVFKTDSSGILTTLHSFDNVEGSLPAAALIRGADGNLYGTTAGDGTTTWGTVFKITPAGAFTPLHSFNESDGGGPNAALIQLPDGAFYGTTWYGGVSGFGTVFKMDSSGTLTTLHSFDNTDGAHPVAALILGTDGNLYGTTAGDFTTTWGTVFKITSAGAFTPLHTFHQTDGAAPWAALIQAADGNFYGTTSKGGANGLGTVFTMDTAASVTTLHSFGIDGSGSEPYAALVQAPGGGLYGTTPYGGESSSDGGTIFQIDSSGNVTTLRSFHSRDGAYPGGAYPFAGLLVATDGSLWGTTTGGGLESGAGTVFRLILGAASLDVTGISPTSGPSSGGTSVSIAGSGFESGARVMMGDSPANAVSVESVTAVSAIAPALLAGTLNAVTVINPSASFGTGTDLWFADFLDVPQGDGFHDYVETIFRQGITAGYGSGFYGRNDSATRAQMAVFLLKAEHGSNYVPPSCTGAFPDVPCPSLFADWIEQLAAEGITAGCSGGLYCPDSSVTRRQMAVFLLKAKESSSYAPPPATGIFGDVPQGDTFAPWIEELYHRGITGGCQASPLLYCPDNPSTRGQMAVFLVRTFGL